MRKRRMLLLAGLILAVVGALARRGSAIGAGNSLTFKTAGSVCRPSSAGSVINGTPVSEWEYMVPWGIHRTCSSCQGTPTVICPLTFVRVWANEPGFLSSVSATVYDRSGTEDVSCTLIVAPDDGQGALLNQTQKSSGSEWGSQTLTWDIPSPTGPNPIQDWKVGQVAVSCTVPAATSFGFSHVTNFTAINSPIPPLTQ